MEINEGTAVLTCSDAGQVQPSVRLTHEARGGSSFLLPALHTHAHPCMGRQNSSHATVSSLASPRLQTPCCSYSYTPGRIETLATNMPAAAQQPAWNAMDMVTKSTAVPKILASHFCSYNCYTS